MISRVVEVLVADKAVCAWDICSHNDISLSLQDNIERLLHRRADVTVAPIDRQTYYAGTFRGPARRLTATDRARSPRHGARRRLRSGWSSATGGSR